LLETKTHQDFRAWVKMPILLQCRFLDHIDLETERLWNALLERNILLEGLSREIEFREIPKSEGWKRLKVAFVDSSQTLYQSGELKLDYGLYSAGYSVFLGNDLIKDHYSTGVLSREQTCELRAIKTILKLSCTNLERETALCCLENEDVDFIVINGGMYRFGSDLAEVLDERIETGKFENGEKLVKDTMEKSVELMNSRKTVCCIRKTRTTALDGWTLYRYGDDFYRVGLNDTEILSELMPKNSWFAYEWVFGEPGLYNYLSGLRETYLKYAGGKKFGEVFEKHKEKLNVKVKKNLCDPADVLEKTSRYYIRKSSENRPLCLETHINTEVLPLITYLIKTKWDSGWFYPMKFVKESVSLPKRLGAKFVEMIQERLVEGIEVNRLPMQI